MELHIDLEYPQGSDDIKIPTPMELQIDLECPQGSNDINIPTPMELQIDLDFHEDQYSHPHGTSN